jgi:hypothetical protein
VDTLTQALLPTLSLIEVLWITCPIIGLMRAIPLTLGWWKDYRYARAHKQEARARAGKLLLAVGVGVSVLLICNLLAGLLSALNPPNRASDEVTERSVGIVLFLMAGQLAVIGMLEVVFWAFKGLVGLGLARLQHKLQDSGV